MVERVPLIKDGESYVLTDSTGRVQERLIEQVGEGGTYLAYKAVEEVDGIAQSVNVILEFYPLVEEDTFSPFQYKREESGQELKIVFQSPYSENLSEEQRRLIYQEELKKQEENALREVQTARELFYNKEKQENSPYLYRTEFFTKMGDTYYLKLDTSEGSMLYSYIKEHENGHLSFQESLEITKKLLEVLAQIFDGAYIHGDIKPQNIWLCGKGEARYIILLDMGSCFSLQENCCQNYETWTEEACIQKADSIVKNRGIGCSTKGYCNSGMNLFFDAKAAYYGARELADLNPLKINLKNKYRAAVRLLDAMNHLNVGADLYSVIETMFYCATGRNYSGETEAELGQLLQEPEVVCKWFVNILRKNQKEGYTSIEQLQKDLNKLERVMNKEADPEVLLAAIRDTLPDIHSIEPSLFGKIK